MNSSALSQADGEILVRLESAIDEQLGGNIGMSESSLFGQVVIGNASFEIRQELIRRYKAKGWKDVFVQDRGVNEGFALLFDGHQ